MHIGRTMLCMVVLVLLLCQGSFADLLFKSGFESNTQVTTPETYSNCVSTFSGTDHSTGYTWPINLGPSMDPNQTGVQNLFASGNAPNPATYYMEPTIETAIGPHGTPTKVLHMNWKHDNPNFGPDQHNFKLGFLSEPSDLYYKYWVKFDTRMMADCRQTANYWRHVWEMKACTPRDDPRDRNCHVDQRIICRIEHDPLCGEPDWTFLVDYYEPQYGDVLYQRYAMTPSEIDRLENGGWLLMEFFFHRDPNQTSNGRFLWKIDGRTILDRRDITFWGTLGKTQVFHMPFMIYAGSSLMNGELWVDDLEIHDSIPPATEYALSASPSSVGPGGRITVNWTASASPHGDLWAWMVVPTDPNNQFLSAPASQRIGAGGTSGTLYFTAPSTPGTYEFRLEDASQQCVGGDCVVVAESNDVTVANP